MILNFSSKTPHSKINLDDGEIKWQAKKICIRNYLQKWAQNSHATCYKALQKTRSSVIKARGFFCKIFEFFSANWKISFSNIWSTGTKLSTFFFCQNLHIRSYQASCLVVWQFFACLISCERSANLHIRQIFCLFISIWYLQLVWWQ